MYWGGGAYALRGICIEGYVLRSECVAIYMQYYYVCFIL